MSLHNIISVDKKFQTSVNLEYDINNIEKITGYIPTEQSVAIIDRFLRGIYYPSVTKRSNVLVGPYGRGKSHLLLILSAIMSLDIISEDKKKARKVLRDLCAKISRVNKQTGDLLESILNSKTRLLPIIINSNGTDINQSLLLALRDALERAGLLNLLPKTHFDAAINVFNMWKENYPDAFKKFVNELKDRKISASAYIADLYKYDIQAYRVFCEIYPKIAAGTEFNPFANTDIIKLYVAVNHVLKETTAFNGIFIIFDEFSKFVEANLDKSKMANFKIIQDLAEIADRESDPQIHFTCVTHKSLLDYSTSDSFKTVEGRFGNIDFVSTSEQSYELIANVIIKKPEFDSFKREHQDEFNKLISVSSGIGLFTDIDNYLEKKLVYGCFPIAPITAYSLLRVSEMIGQNERTVFTFLAQEEKGTLLDFIKSNDGFKLITVDTVYNYFQDLFKKSAFNETVHSMWAKANTALYQTENEDAKKIIKALSIIGIIGDERFRPVSTHIKAALNMDDEMFDKAIKYLIERSFVAQRESSEYVLLTANGVDVQNNVNNFINSKLIKLDKCGYLNNLIENKYLIPRKYNDEFSMIRYFQVKFIEADELIKIKNWQQLFNDISADGLLLNVIFSNKLCADEVIYQLSEYINQQQIIACVPNIDEVFNDLPLKQLYAVEELKKSDAAKSDRHYFEELEVYQEDVEKRLLKYINSLYSAESKISQFYNCDGKIPEIRKQVNLNKIASTICELKYGKAPKINNEMINKNHLTAPIKKARELIVKHVLESSEQVSIPTISGFGPEASIFRSVFVATGLDKTLSTNDEGLNAVLEEIESFVKMAENHKQNISDLCDTLIASPYGARKGIIPMLFAYVLRKYKENIIIYYKKNEVELSADLLCSIIDEAGSNYQILLENGTKIKEDSILELLNIYEQFADTQSKSINNIYNVVKRMQNWMRSIPAYTRHTQKIYDGVNFVDLTQEEISFRRELLKFEINSREFLYEFVLGNNTTSSSKDAVEWVKNIKNKLDSHLSNIRLYLIDESRKVFGYKNGSTLSSAILAWRQTLESKTIKHMFDTKCNQVLSYLLSINNFDDDKIISDLCKVVSGIILSDWNDDTLNSYLERLSHIVITINNFNASSEFEDGQNGFDLMINGEKFSKTYSKVNTTPIGITVMNNIESVFEEYGDSITPDEKLHILLNILKDLIC